MREAASGPVSLGETPGKKIIRGTAALFTSVTSGGVRSGFVHGASALVLCGKLILLLDGGSSDAVVLECGELAPRDRGAGMPRKGRDVLVLCF